MTTPAYSFVCRCGAGAFGSDEFMTHIAKVCPRILPSIVAWARNMLQHPDWRVRVGLDPPPGT